MTMNKTPNNNFCVILAGGKGRRLWPCSRESYPKQFIDFFGSGKTQLQQTYERFAKIIPQENIFINTNEAYIDIVKEQLPNVPESRIMAEPIYRNTAPSVAWAAHRILKICPEANLIVSPSDQTVINEDAFKDNVIEGFEFVEKNNCLLTMGVKPTRPEPGYGYVQIGDNTDFDDIYKVKSFIEKPEREFARVFMENGEWYWNTGIFLSNVRYLADSLCKLLPVVLRKLDQDNEDWKMEDENLFVKENFPLYPNLSIDFGVLEKSDNVFLKKCDFGWADLGTWHGIYESMQKSENDNVVINSDVILENSHSNVIKLPKDKLAVINGLDGYIVAEKDNVLLICKKEDSSALVRKYVTEVQMKKGDKFI
ncbi:mannose-1-phosphate guanylyltransferase [Prevotella herbatica]|uniref:Mannose-1-phosphate guanylyltransferase n=2 Tax=Prevotella herbatica TaxID=2801997 RepID=A0ABN6EJW2_9BACT|nr:mannose-1-phosphate guanylyltransferase [Prevotella herbatica]